MRLVRFSRSSAETKRTMPLPAVETPWAKFATSGDLALVGRDAIAMASGIYARFYHRSSGTVRVERFQGGERGDGVCCLAGLSAAPIFSVAERKANPRISIFAYPAMRRISSCAESERAIGYLCCAFAGTEYLVGQTTFPDFRLVLWHWRTGQRLATVDGADAATLGVDAARLACSSDSARFVARLAESGNALQVYRVVACSSTVRLFPIEASSTGAPVPVSCSWATGGTLLCCDESGTAWSVDFEKEEEEEERHAEIIVQGSGENRSGRNPLVVGHGGGALVVDFWAGERVRATFYRKAWKDREERWRASWTTRLATYPRHAESDPREDRILMLGENGELYEMQGASRDHPPRVELLLRGDARYARIAPLSDSHFAAFDETDRLAILHAATGSVVSRPKRVSHHGKVADSTSHPALPILASCTAAGSFLLVEAAVPSRPRVAGCAHLQREPLDRVKFSDGGRMVGVAASQIGRLFLVLPNLAEAERESAVRVAGCLNPRRKVIDFLVYETGERGTAKAVLLLGGSESTDRRTGNELAVYSCEFSDREDLREDADRSIKLGRSFESVHYGTEGSRDAIGVPYLTKQLHRIELREDFGEARLSEALPSLHQTRGIRVGDRSAPLLLTYGFDGLIVLRESAELRRVWAVLVAHHRSQAGVESAVLVDTAVVSLGRNGDLVANRMAARRASRSTSSGDWVEPRARGAGTLQGTWMDEWISRRTAAEESRSLASRDSVLRDWSQLKRQVKTLLDSNEAMPAAVRLPVSAFDLDAEARERELAEGKARAERALREAEERVAGQHRASRYLRQRFLDPLIVPPRSIFSFFGRLKVANYPLVKLTPRETNFPSWCRLSMETRQLVSRLEGEEVPRTGKLESPWDRCDGFADAFEACAIAEQQERQSKAAFNERFEEMRSAKEKESRAARERANETRRLVLELRDAFHLDASSSLLRVPRCDSSEAIESAPSSSVDSADEARPAQRESEQEADLSAFPREALEKMMDGVLEVRLEDSAKRHVRKPDCLLRKDPSSYTEADVREVEAYERKVRARQIDRQKYKSLLESEIERLRGEYRESLRAFDDELRELAAEKIRVERSILSRRLLEVEAVLRHRNAVRERRDVELAVRLRLTPAAQQARGLAETCDLFEAAAGELRIDYENARKREKLLEGKFREEYAESKASTSELLLRQFRKRPKVLTATCSTSVTFLLELAACAIDGLISDALPAECCCYLRAMDELDESSKRLLSRLEVDHWSSLCRLRRLKVEAEIKAKCCAIEVAEAEQSLAFLRNARASARAEASRRRQEIERLEKRLPDLATDREISLLLKAGQLRIRAKGCPRTDWQRAVLVPRGELERANLAIARALQQRLLAQRRLADIRQVVSLQEWRHARDKAKMRDLRDRARELDRFKVSRVARECCQLSEGEAAPDQGEQRIWSALRARRKAGEEEVERERARWQRVAAETRVWRRRSAEWTRKIDRSKAERDDLVIAARSPLRVRVAAFKRRKIRAIRRKAHLVRQVQDHSRQLSSLESRLEISKLRTYPTLRFKF